eukprot:Amastigsp_a349816_4.p2 type:complete len:187 gc:universal Amastigsp_a349816_4:940-380(-)
MLARHHDCHDRRRPRFIRREHTAVVRDGNEPVVRHDSVDVAAPSHGTQRNRAGSLGRARRKHGNRQLVAGKKRLDHGQRPKAAVVKECPCGRPQRLQARHHRHALTPTAAHRLEYNRHLEPKRRKPLFAQLSHRERIRSLLRRNQNGDRNVKPSRAQRSVRRKLVVRSLLHRWVLPNDRHAIQNPF